MRGQGRSDMPTIVVSPFNVINFAEGGGHFWVYMQYAQALRLLGCDVYWLESFASNGNEESDQARLAPLLARMERFGLGSKLVLYPRRVPGSVAGLPEEYTGNRSRHAARVENEFAP